MTRPPLVAALVYDNLCTFEFGSVVEVFGLDRPELPVPLYRFRACAVDTGQMRACGGLSVTAAHGLEVLSEADTILIPGWRDAETPPSAALVAALRAARARGARLASICAGSVVLAYAGFLNGRRATTHWKYAERMRALFPDVTVDERVLYIDHGDILMSAGSAAGLDMCLHIVRKDYGEAVANSVARRLVIPPYRDGGQAQFIDRPVPRADRHERFARMTGRVLQDLAGDHSVRSMAELTGMSERSFQRHFTAAYGISPARWLTSERVKYARQLLESTGLGIGEIARASGLGGEANLRHQFNVVLDTSPGRYRRFFNGGLRGI